MEKYQFQLDNIQIGNQSPTALNILIGANSAEQYQYENKRIEALNACDLPISIITDLSLHKNPGGELWRRILCDQKFIAGTVPVYQAVRTNKTISPIQLLELIYEQAECGVKLMTIHPTPDHTLLEMSKNRLVPITSRGGAAVSIDMLLRHTAENVYIQNIDEIIKIATTFNITLSIGSSFRSANLRDAADQTYFLELEKQLEIAEYCWTHGVNSIIETPGHASPQSIFSICKKLRQSCPYPIMPLGPMPTDCALDQDDLAAAMGAVLMGTNGCADILSVVTMDEHIGGVPSIESLIAAIQKYAVAKHIIDIYKLNDTDIDNSISLERSKNTSCIFGSSEKCTRCSTLCPLEVMRALKSE